jgi:hypothetical protein
MSGYSSGYCLFSYVHARRVKAHTGTAARTCSVSERASVPHMLTRRKPSHRATRPRGSDDPCPASRVRTH